MTNNEKNKTKKNAASNNNNVNGGMMFELLRRFVVYNLFEIDDEVDSKDKQEILQQAQIAVISLNLESTPVYVPNALQYVFPEHVIPLSKIAAFHTMALWFYFVRTFFFIQIEKTTLTSSSDAFTFQFVNHAKDVYEMDAQLAVDEKSAFKYLEANEAFLLKMFCVLTNLHREWAPDKCACTLQTNIDSPPQDIIKECVSFNEQLNIKRNETVMS